MISGSRCSSWRRVSGAFRRFFELVSEGGRRRGSVGAGLGSSDLSREELNSFGVERERDLRMHYDERGRDHPEVGLRLGEDNEWLELHRWLADREFRLLFLGHLGSKATFAGKPLEESAESFICSVTLVGSDNPRQYHLNSTAVLISDRLGFPEGSWGRIGPGD
jgi:hypothetical protein